MIKHLPSKALEEMADLFNACDSEGILSECLRHPLVTKENPSPSDMRPIAVLPSLATWKTQARMITLSPLVQPQLSDMQYGARDGMTTMTPVAKLHGRLQRAREGGPPVMGVQIDVRKFFDKPYAPLCFVHPREAVRL